MSNTKSVFQIGHLNDTCVIRASYACRCAIYVGHGTRHWWGVSGLHRLPLNTGFWCYCLWENWLFCLPYMHVIRWWSWK